MPTYLVCQKVRTVANLHGEYRFRGFTFRSLEPERGLAGDAWEASNEVTANDFRAAFHESRQSLLPVVDAISVVTQCSASLIATSAFVYRLDHNDERNLFLYVARHREPVGISLSAENQTRDLEKLMALPGAAMQYLRDANNASTIKTQLAMLVIAAESLAGQITVTRSCRKCGESYSYGGTDKTKLRDVLGEPAFEKLYEKDGGSLRHRLFHGNTVEADALGPTTADVYNGLRSYLQVCLGLESFERIQAAPRSFNSHEHGYLFIRLHEANIPRLRTLESNWQDVGELINGEPPEY